MDVFGLLSIVVAVVLSALWWSLYDTAHPPPEAEQDPFRSLAMSGMFVGGVPLLPAQPAGPETLDRVLARIGKAGGYGAPSEFLEGAQQAYEVIVTAVASGELDGVRHLLTDMVREDFEAFVTARRQRGETESLTLIGLNGADVIAASFEDVASIDVRLSADIVSVTCDRAGHVVEGRPDRVVRVADIWTFERDMTQRTPRWLLAATDADE